MSAVPKAANERLTLAALNRMDRAAFTAALGSVFEHAPWVAERAFGARPFTSLDALHAAMVQAVNRAGRARQLDLVGGHPDLAGRAAVAGALTPESRGEQAGAGLDQCTPAELARFQKLNARYRAKFGFPFVMAVTGRSRDEILKVFEARLSNDESSEFMRALAEVWRIARFRLDALIAEERP